MPLGRSPIRLACRIVVSHTVIKRDAQPGVGNLMLVEG